MITTIFGLSATGKTTFVQNMLKDNPGLEVVHTDDYIQGFNFKEAMYAVMERMDDLMETRRNQDIAVEGVQVARLLRKWAELGKTPENLRVIYLSCNPVDRQARHAARGTQINQGADKAFSSVWNEWLLYNLPFEGINTSMIPV